MILPSVIVVTAGIARRGPTDQLAGVMGGALSAEHPEMMSGHEHKILAVA